MLISVQNLPGSGENCVEKFPPQMMCQHFSGQLFKLLFVVIRNQRVINNHWLNECVLDYKRFQYIQI